MKRIACAALLVALATGATAQSQDELVRQSEALTLDYIQNGFCGSDVPCEPATKEERLAYPLPTEMSYSVVLSAAQSVAAKECGLDHSSVVFQPMMRAARITGAFSDRQLAFIAVQHGVALGLLESAGIISCTAQWRGHFGLE